MNLYDFQQDIIDRIQDNYRRGYKRILVQAPTGSGKSMLIKYLADNSSHSCSIITHRKELKQMFESKTNVTVHMVETFHRRDLEYTDLLLLDEVHITNLDKVLDNAPESTTIIGFTATPIRKGKQRSLDTLYDVMIKGPKAEDLIERGFLVPTINYSHESFDWTKAKKTAGDYDLTYQSVMFEQRRVYEGVVSNYRRVCDGTKAIIFTPDIDSSRKLARHLQDNNLPARSVDSQLDKRLRDETIEWFSNSKNGILVNCSLLTTGFDCPDIETVILYRATTSRALFNQMVGRGVRTSPNKTRCTVLDFGENIKRFGFWEDDYEYTLTKKTKKKDYLPPVRLCPKCDRMNKTTDKTCIHCSFVFPVKVIKPEEVDLELVIKKPKIGYYLHQAKTVEEAHKIIKEYGYKPGWWYINKHRYPHLTNK
jgi:superfamily II DNA or RNA helicase